MFIVFGVMCLLGAIQFYATYPETCNKSLEEIEEMFSPNGPKAWNTKRGHSKLDDLVAQAREKRHTVHDINEQRQASTAGKGHPETRDIEKA